MPATPTTTAELNKLPAQDDVTVPKLIANVDAAYDVAVNEYVASWNNNLPADSDDRMNRSEVIRVAVARFIDYAYTRQRATRTSKYATPELAAAAIAANNKRRQECADLTKLRSDIIGTLAAEDTDTLTTFVTATAGWYKRLDALTQEERTTARNDMVHVAQQHNVTVLERKVRAPRKLKSVTVKYIIPDGNGGTKEVNEADATLYAKLVERGEIDPKTGQMVEAPTE